MRKGPLILAALVLFSLLASIAAQAPGADSPIPTLTNTGPRGLAALATWLREGGVTVIAHDAPLTELPAEARVVVLPAPAGAELRKDEVETLKRFVHDGGTLIYLVPRAAPQPVLNEWLSVGTGSVAPLVTEPGLNDVGGTSVSVTFSAGLLEGAQRLRLSADRTLRVSDERAVPVTSEGAVWWLRRGQGEVWLAAGADLAENARLELADNALFWSHLAGRGLVVFDEFHHHQGASAVPVSLLITGLQLGFLALLVLWARATRLGPARDEPPNWHRSSLEYVSAMAALTRNARVEPELVISLKNEFRRFLRDARSVPMEWTWEEAEGELVRQGALDPGVLLKAAQQVDFVALSRELARLELQLRS